MERLPIDCQLTEAMATGFDPLHLAQVFGISEQTAIRYSVNAQHLLGSAHGFVREESGDASRGLG